MLALVLKSAIPKIENLSCLYFLFFYWEIYTRISCALIKSTCHSLPFNSCLIPFPNFPLSTSGVSFSSVKTHSVRLMLSVCAQVWDHPLVHGPVLQVLHLWRKITLPSLVAIYCQQLLRYGLRSHEPSIYTGLRIGLTSCRYYVHCHSSENSCEQWPCHIQ